MTLTYSDWLARAADQQDRFWSKVSKNGSTVRPEIGPCWLWLSSKDKDGYGKFSITGPAVNKHNTQKHVRAHKLAWELVNGVVPKGLLLRHICDVRSCVRPDHIVPGTQRENCEDCRIRGRSRAGADHWTKTKTKPELIRRGVSAPRSLLSEAVVVEIRRLYADGVPAMDIMRNLGLPRRQYHLVWGVVRGKTYTTVVSKICLLTPAQWRERLVEFNRACAYCLKSCESLTQDHMIPVSRGGTDTYDNVVPACMACNLKKGTKSMFMMIDLCRAGSTSESNVTVDEIAVTNYSVFSLLESGGVKVP